MTWLEEMYYQLCKLVYILKVIDAPVDGKLSAVAKDGIEVRARARVTVRTDIPNLVGGATEDTIIARVGEGIVSAIGSRENLRGSA